MVPSGLGLGLVLGLGSGTNGARMILLCRVGVVRLRVTNPEYSASVVGSAGREQPKKTKEEKTTQAMEST